MILPAMSTCDISQPPKISPYALVSAGMAITRMASSLSSGSSFMP
jgi:hypothetical protein